jgi:hypothetical protein
MGKPLTILLLPLLVILANYRPGFAKELPWHLSGQFFTRIPVDIAPLRLDLEGPFRLRTMMSFGFVPDGYLNLISDMLVAIDEENRAVAEVMRTGVDSAFSWHWQLGWRIFEDWGVYLALGYGLIAAGGGLASGNLLNSVAGEAVSNLLPSIQLFEVRATLHMLDFEVGYQWLVWQERIAIVAGLGFSLTVAASTTLSPQSRLRDIPFLSTVMQLSNVQKPVEEELNDTFTNDFHTPTVFCGLGYRFF